MKANWPKAKSLTGLSEGGFVDHPDDNGGPTNWGITIGTLASYRGHPVTKTDVRNLTKAEAEKILKTRYWDVINCDLLPSGLDYMAFDFYVNGGPAVRELQKLLKVNPDGVIGDKTLKAIDKYPGGLVKLMRDYCDSRMRYLQSLKGKKGFPTFGRGWTIRVTGKDPLGKYAPQPGVIGNALAMIHEQDVTPTEASASLIMDAPAPVSETGLSSILAKTDSITALATTATGTVAAVSANTILSYALAIVILAGGAYWLYERVRKTREGKIA